MQWMRRYVAAAGAMALAALTTGCPAPVLDVSPDAVSIGAAESAAELRIDNTGSGTLTWNVVEDLPWLDTARVDKQTDPEGSITTETAVVELRVNRALLPVGNTRGEVTVTSNGGNVVVPVSVEQGGPAQLSVSTDSLPFGATTTQQTFVISNIGLEPLTWELDVPEGAPWLSAAPVQGTIAAQNGVETITVAVNRGNTPAGDFSAPLTITSNGGTDSVVVSMSVIPFSVSPSALTYGVLQGADSDNLTIRNGGAAPVALTYTTATTDGADWLNTARNGDTIGSGGQVQLSVTANPAGLAPGSYTGSVTVANVASGFSIQVPVSMGVTALSVAPETLAFGEITAAASDSFVVTNLGDEAVTYEINVPVADQDWLVVTPTSATVNNTQAHTVTVNPLAVEPGAYESAVEVDYGSGVETVTVTMERPRPARLVVVSQNVNLGTAGVEEKVDIWNDGIGSINWSIDTSGFPAWLTLVESTGGTASGAVSGEQTDTITLRVDRALAPSGSFDFEHVFNVVGTGDVSTSLPVTIRMTVPQIPEIEIIADDIDDTGIPFINLDVDTVSKSFIIRNNGNGILEWSFNPLQFPAWVASITPSQAGLNPGTEQSVTVTVDRSSLNFNGAQVRLDIANNDPSVDNGLLPFIIEVQVPKRVAITARPGSIAFGTDESISLVEIANDGDPGTELLYRLRSTKENWLKVFPDTGSSIGTESAVKDFKPHTVAIVRSELEGSGSSGKLIAEAIRTNELGQIELVPDVAPLEINISVEAAELTFENALPRLRVPSMVRFVLLMRNLRFQPIPIAETRLNTLADQVQILENDRPLETSETGKVAKGARAIQGNVLVLLDYSNSMQEAAGDVADVTISGAPDPLQALYERTISQLFEEIPDNYRVGLAIFSERSGTGGGGVVRDSLNPIYGTVSEGPDTEDELFLSDRSLLQDRLDNIFVATNGATELYPAIGEASQLIVEEDNIAGIFPYDDADDRILLCVTDGRATTPPGQIADITDQMALIDGTRAFVIGWGNEVSTGPLVLLSTATGGHVYATDTEVVNQGGAQVEVPVVEELENYCDTDAADPCDLSVRRDLESQFVLSYVSLAEEANVEVEGRLTFDDPNDQASACLPEQGEISGKFTAPQTQLLSVAGDPRLGQIKLIYSGLQPDGTGEVTVYLDSAVRDIRQLSFTLGTVNADPLTRADVTVAPRTEGGLVAGWNLSGGGLTFTFDSPDGTPLTFGDFGPLCTVDISGINVDGLLTFDVLAPLRLANDPNTKYLTAPDSLRLDIGAFTATSFARPSIELDTVNGLPVNPLVHRIERLATGELVFDLGTDVNEFTLAFYNLGGSHEPTEVGLQYLILPNSQGIVRPPGNAADDWAEPEVYSTLAPQIRPFIVDRTIPGSINGILEDPEFQLDFEYELLGIGYSGEIEPLYLQLEVLEPAITVAPTDITFPALLDTQQFTITNTGQGILNWSLDPNDTFPLWLTSDVGVGVLQAGESEVITLTAFRAGQPSPSVQTFSFDVLKVDLENPDSVQVDVTLIVP
jgi:hypothetical protein